MEKYLRHWTIFAIAMASVACSSRHDPPRAAYVTLAEAEAAYGVLITSGNHPTPNQNGTGERIGLFQDAQGTVWGLPLTTASDGSILACAPPMLHESKATDTVPAGWTIVGAMNEPTGWRGGTGDLELLLRDSRGAIQWKAVHSAKLIAGPSCWAPDSPGPPQQLDYYRVERQAP